MYIYNDSVIKIEIEKWLKLKLKNEILMLFY